ncbi:MAG: nitroreductase [Dorea sp.]|jgi:nitroreductase|nr:nitroreductase [Dorea sp.]
MEFQKVIESRRSIRKYDPNQKVTRTQVEEMIKAAMLAPTWKNSQTARYYCVISEEMMNQVRSECLPAFNANNSADAGALIATAFVKDISGYERTGEPSNELGNGWGIYDLGLANENLILKAEEMGLGTLVMGIRDEKKLCELLQIPESETLVSVIAVGYAAVNPKMPARKTLEDVAVFL